MLYKKELFIIGMGMIVLSFSIAIFYLQTHKEDNMRKTIDFTKEQIQIVENYKKEHNLKNFSQSLKEIIENTNKHKGGKNTTLLKEISKKLDNISMHLAPKSAGRR